MARFIKKVIKYAPIRTFLIYFIIAAFLIIAFKVPVSKMLPEKPAAVQTGVVSIEIQLKPTGICDEGSTKTQKCGTGLCAGTQTVTCVNGRWITDICSGNVYATPEVCDGVDNNCDGAIDNNLEPPHCGLTLGVCAGPYYKKCGGAEGWLHCTDADYGPDYEVVEVDCSDKLDNDCDGAIDGYDDVACQL